MAFTTNKGLSVPAAGTLSGTWGAGSSESINEGVTELLDDIVGGLNSTALSSSDVTLTAAQGRHLIQRLTGTLSANVTITTPNIGFNIWENQTTAAFTVTVQFTGGAGDDIVVPQGATVFTITDSTNGVRATNGFPKQLIAGADLTPSTITADQNNYAPTGHADVFRFRLASDATRTITGLAGGTPGRIIVIANVGSNDIRIASEDSSSTAANRFAVGTTINIAAGRAAGFQYDATSSRWRALHNADALTPAFDRIDLAENASPGNPSADTARLYALDDSGTTVLAYRRSDASRVKLIPASLMFDLRPDPHDPRV
jgi:hypothetical protein